MYSFGSRLDDFYYTVDSCQERGAEIYQKVVDTKDLVKKVDITMSYVYSKLLTCLPSFSDETEIKFGFKDYKMCVNMRLDFDNPFVWDSIDSIIHLQDFLNKSCNIIRNTKAIFTYFFNEFTDMSFTRARRFNNPFNVNFNVIRSYDKLNHEHVLLHFLVNNTFIMFDSSAHKSFSFRKFARSLFYSCKYAGDNNYDFVDHTFELIFDKIIPITIISKNKFNNCIKAKVVFATLKPDLINGNLITMEYNQVECKAQLLYTFDDGMICSKLKCFEARDGDSDFDDYWIQLSLLIEAINRSRVKESSVQNSEEDDDIICSTPPSKKIKLNEDIICLSPKKIKS